MPTDLELESLRQELQKAIADVEDPALFRHVLEQGMKALALNDGDLSVRFAVSRPTITRWRNGTNAPHPAMRKPVYVWLDRRAAGALKRNVGAPASGRPVRNKPVDQNQHRSRATPQKPEPWL